MEKAHRLAGLLAGISIVAFTTPAMAQITAAAGASPPPLTVAQAAPAGGDQPASQEIVITGSRIARSPFETPTPVTAISQKQLEAKAAPTVVDLLRDLPSLRPNRNNGSATDVGTATFDLRSLGATRTLVLIDGQRVMNSSPTGGFDVNLLPAPLIQRMEIVTGGASSVYGSNAVSGVVNVFLDGNLTGLKVDGQNNISQHGDAENYTVNVAWGTRFAGDKGHFVIAGSYFDQPDILYQGSRAWGSRGVTLIPNSAYTPTNGQYRQLIVPDARLSSMTYGGVITSNGPLKNIQFGVNGAQSQFVQGTNVSSVWMQGGEGLELQPDFAVLQPSTKRINGYSRATYDFSPALQGHLDVLAARTKQHQTNNYNYNNGDIVIQQDNAFLPTNIRDIMVANNIKSFNMGRLNQETGIDDNTTTDTYIRTSGGLKGGLFADWSWDGNVNYTWAKYSNVSLNNRINANWTNALDSVIGPGGTPICRSTLTNPNNGCVAANPFGLNSVSPEAAAYVTGTSYIRAISTQIDGNLNAKGNLFETWAGPVATAVGAEARRETVHLTSDPISAINGWRQASSAPYHGAVTVKEVYLEMGVPLLRDLPFAKKVQLDLAGRYVDYSTSGSTGVWKVGGTWAVNDSIRFRSSYSRDFRAPTINELFAATTIRQGTAVIDRTNNQSVVVATSSGGNPDLKPEVAHTFTAGVVLQPSFLPNFQASVDYFDIKLDGAITTLGAQEVLDRCAAGASEFCSAVTRNGAGTITQVQTTTFNAQVLKTRGLDMAASYHIPLDGIGADLSLSEVATYVAHLITVSNGVTVDTAGQLTGTNAVPKWRSATTLIFEKGPALFRILGNYVGGGNYDNTYGPLDINKDHYKGIFYVDLSVEYRINEHFQLYAKVENLFDKDPPLLAENTIVRAGAASASSFYDFVGRDLGIGARIRW